MAKRQAASELNHDNWNDPEKPEKQGTFQRASADEIGKRVIKIAQRKSIHENSSPSKSPFAKLADFKMAPKATSSPFSFLKNGSVSNNFEAPSKNDATISSDKSKEPPQKSEEASKEYHSKLKGLNESVSEWIKVHVDKNPLCDLTPIFKDYERYLQEIEKRYKDSSATTVKENKVIFSSDWSKTSSFGTSSNTGLSSKTDDATKETNSLKPLSTSPSSDKAPTFTFGSGSSSGGGTTTATESKKTTSEFPSIFAKARSEAASLSSKLGSGASPESGKKEASPSTGTMTFSSPLANKSSFFGSSTNAPPSTGFSFSNVGTNSVSGTNKADDEDYQPPKPVFTPVQEEGAVYSKRCKVFIRKGSSYQDRGVGNLFLKPLTSDEKKTQLIVRADTSLGNLLINCLLNASMSPQKMGGNNVVIACLPTPESEPPPVPVLLKIKTSEEADEVLEKLKEFIAKNK